MSHKKSSTININALFCDLRFAIAKCKQSAFASTEKQERILSKSFIGKESKGILSDFSDGAKCGFNFHEMCCITCTIEKKSFNFKQ